MIKFTDNTNSRDLDLDIESSECMHNKQPLSMYAQLKYCTTEDDFVIGMDIFIHKRHTIISIA